MDDSDGMVVHYFDAVKKEKSGTVQFGEFGGAGCGRQAGAVYHDIGIGWARHGLAADRPSCIASIKRFCSVGRGMRVSNGLKCVSGSKRTSDDLGCFGGRQQPAAAT